MGKKGLNELSRFSRMIREICTEEEIELFRAAGGWAFRFQKGERTAALYGYHFGINSAASSEICNSKSTTSEFLLNAGIDAVPHKPVYPESTRKFISDALTESDAAEELTEQKCLVLKNDTGTGGTEVYLVRTKEELMKTAKKLFTAGKTMTYSPFVSIAREVRVVVLDGEALLMFSKERPGTDGDTQTKNDTQEVNVSENWKHNLGQGATPKILRKEEAPGDWEELSELAYLASRALGIRFASVDIVEEEGTGRRMVLEVNSGVMLEHFSGFSPEYYKIAKEIYRKAMLLMVGEES